MLLYDLLSLLDVIAPLRFAEPWDNTGLLTGNPDAAITRVLLTIDLTHAVAEEAICERCELCVAYHPIVFEPIKRVPHDTVLSRAIRAGLAVYSPHTALDVAPGGTNDAPMRWG
jgi:putative NIF3 family GTP cyclohydrolase 1 type 2